MYPTLRIPHNPGEHAAEPRSESARAYDPVHSVAKSPDGKYALSKADVALEK